MEKLMTHITLDELDNLMPAVLRHSADLSGEVERRNPAIGWFRISAFPIYAESAEQLEAQLRTVTPESERAIRRRFSTLLDTLARTETVYIRFRGRGEPAMAERLGSDANVLDKLERRLTETSSADVYVPRRAVMMEGHDEFGCQCYFLKTDPKNEIWIRQLVVGADLHCVRPSMK